MAGATADLGIGCVFFVPGALDHFSACRRFLSVFLLLYGLRFRHFAVVFTNAQLFLNQGDFFRARELLLTWMKEYDGSEPVVHRPGELVFHAIYHGTERALRQYFSLFFWFLALPGPMGLVVDGALECDSGARCWQAQALLSAPPCKRLGKATN